MEAARLDRLGQSAWSALALCRPYFLFRALNKSGVYTQTKERYQQQG